MYQVGQLQRILRNCLIWLIIWRGYQYIELVCAIFKSSQCRASFGPVILMRAIIAAIAIHIL